ncbi:MAG: type VI secretion system contractile sheath large subunit [Marinospirillum sp.]|uniref:type VI secretion system contractile sheath domain-containing protein n=1 Tax=Marinospirillum sp. TaxID=2183934 RepID=UPI0019E17558|nr:type VI secretion system contractile sheath large subunit [Marinospirillum sp.]MBE0506343.1 type VI secretion system contractile sheath large subunit [Marinospirillum sp.]
MDTRLYSSLQFDAALSGSTRPPLPCRILVLADLGLSKPVLTPVSTQGYSGINDWLQHQQPEVLLQLPDLGELKLQIDSLRDLHPQQLLRQIQQHLILPDDDFLQLQQLKQALHQVNRVLHHPRIRQLEATWRSLDRLIRFSADHPATEILLLHQSREDLQENLTSTALVDSPLFQKIYAEELGQYGGLPYSLILVDQQWSNNQQDLLELEALAKLGQAAHAPILTSVAPSLLGLDQFSQTLTPELAAELNTSRNFIKLRQLMQQPACRYLNLVLPRVLVRPPHALQLEEAFFQEQPLDDEDAMLWGNPCYSLCSLVLNSFQQHGSYTGMLNSPGDEDPLLAAYQLNPHTPPLPPIEARWPQETLSAFAHQGFTLAGVGQHFSIAFEQPVALHTGAGHNTIIQPDYQLPYVLTLSRVAHYLKLVLREQLGGSETLNNLETRLNQWLQGSVSAQEKPSAEVMHRKPFREALLKISISDQQQPEIHLQLTPHLRHQGQDFKLNLTSTLAGDVYG